jgi:methionyl-tRNA synthetase
MDPLYITTAIPYVNAAPHLGHALELVETDALARHARSRGRAVRFLTGTDDHAAKNVAAATAAGVPVATFVATNAQRFADLRAPLELSNEDFLRTSSDPRHRPAVERLWARCAGAGDLYRRRYEGLFCTGCEQFVEPDDLIGGVCREHLRAPELLAEDNWFFRLSRYQDPLHDALTSGRLRIQPEARRNEVLAFVEAGVRDFSVSRPRGRSDGWGIPVPGDPTQIIYVWFDALVNYISALGFGNDDVDYERWWNNTSDRVHVVGKGILRFHAISWPAMLLSAGVPLPTTVFVHDYLTVDGTKISKSLGNTVEPVALVDRFGTDALRWWLLRAVPRVGDTDFTVAGLVDTANRDLANGFGNLVSRVVSLVHTRRAGVVPSAAIARESSAATLATRVDGALERFDFRAALDAISDVVTETNRYLEAEKPWSRDERPLLELDIVLRTAVEAARIACRELAPFVPDFSARALHALGAGRDTLPPAAALFPRLTIPAHHPGFSSASATPAVAQTEENGGRSQNGGR